MGSTISDSVGELDIAIIGMAGRFPGARNIREFWQNLRDGVESISFFSDDELEEAGEDPALIADPRYVKARGILHDVDRFDAAFFGFNPREAEMMDPQQRLFLECAWEALENGGYDADQYRGLIGVFGGVGTNSYLMSILAANGGVVSSAEGYQLIIGNDKDFLTTRVSYKLNLRGPSVDVQTACSTSLVAVHMACQNLLAYQCDMALAGGVTITLPQQKGYLYEEGMILSPDGHCRAFDANARGTVGGNGVGIVVLKRLADAVEDGDHIYAVIKGSALNNDGSLRVGFTAPGVEGQAEVIAAAQAIAGVEPDTIGYIEAHGTGTTLGDPIEIEALTQVFREKTDAKRYCAIGSVKTNVGHLDAAAGVAGLIKAALALKHKTIPPSLHFSQPNPKIDFDNSPFYVSTEALEWKAGDTPRRAGVSSFGIGGTNVHVVLEEASVVADSSSSRPWQLLMLSAKSQSALDTATANLAEHLKEHPNLNLADVSYTLQVGRKAFSHRRVLVCDSLESAMDALEKNDPKRVFSSVLSSTTGEPPVAFMFSGQGAQYTNMGAELYQLEPVFRQHVDLCSQLLFAELKFDLRQVLFPSDVQTGESSQRLDQTYITQPALFVIEYALAKLWMSWGVEPEAMIGHSIGEYVAACLAGVFSLEDALTLVALRGRMMQDLPPGAMLSVPLEESELLRRLPAEVALAAVNAPSSCVVSGPTEAIDKLESRLAAEGIECRRLRTSHAFHSKMMEPILASFERQVSKIRLNAPAIPYLSNVTGTWATDAEACDPQYWVKHLRQTVRFSDGVQELLKEPNRILLEVGPGQTLSTLARRHGDRSTSAIVLNSLRHPKERHSDVAFILNTLGKLWLAGVNVDWAGFYANEKRLRLPLPSYPFERERFWINGKAGTLTLGQPSPPTLGKNPDVAKWFYVPSWKRSDLAETIDGTLSGTEAKNWLVFVDNLGFGLRVAKRLEQLGQRVSTVHIGDEFTPSGNGSYIVDPQEASHYLRLLEDLEKRDLVPEFILHMWSVTDEDPYEPGDEHLEQRLARGYHSLLFLAQAIGKSNLTHPLHLGVISTNLQEVCGHEVLHPEKAAVLGPCKVIPQEYPNITCRSIDLEFSESTQSLEPKLIDSLIGEFIYQPPELTVAYRWNHRWAQIYESVHLNGEWQKSARLREGGVYLITGGLGRIGLVIADYLTEAFRAKVVLLGRSPLPARSEWSSWLDSHPEEDEICRKIRRLLAMEERGGQVRVLQADVADEQQMRRVLAQIDDEFGILHGVIHAAGHVGEQSIRPIQELDRQESEQQFRAKVQGVRVLHSVLEGRELDFCLLLSSVSSMLGGLGFTAYAAANQYMDTFVHRQHQANGTTWISVNWDAWKFDDEKKQVAASGLKLDGLAITPQEGVEVLQRVLSGVHLPQIVISTGNLQARFAQWIQRESADPTESGDGSAASAPRHSRPNLQTTYVAPSTELEERIADIWKRLLGLEEIGIFDNFFELGGNSLLGTQLVSELRNAFRIEFPLRALFEDPTIAAVAKVIEAAEGEQREEEDRIAKILEQVEELSDEEVKALLAKQSEMSGRSENG